MLCVLGVQLLNVVWWQPHRESLATTTSEPCRPGNAGHTWDCTLSRAPLVRDVAVAVCRCVGALCRASATSCVCADVFRPCDTPGFSIGAPAFPSVNVTLPPSALAAFSHGGRFVAAGNSVVTSIIAHGASPTAVYVSKAMANGVPLPTPFVTWEQLVNGGKGGELEFWMSETPSTWG